MPPCGREDKGKKESKEGDGGGIQAGGKGEKQGRVWLGCFEALDGPAEPQTREKPKKKTGEENTGIRRFSSWV